jgi:hypothetical protein
VKPKASKSGTSQTYDTKIERGTARPVAISLDAEWIARFDALCERDGLTRSELVRQMIAAAEARK